MPNGTSRSGSMDKTKWTKAGEETWEVEEGVVVETLWYSALSNMRKRASIHLDSEDIRKARQSIFADYFDSWFKKFGRIMCYLGIAGAGLVARKAFGPTPSYDILFVCVAGFMSIWALLEFVLNKR